MLKRGFDIIFSLLGIIVLLPFFIIISILILLSSTGGVFYFQQRVGKNNKDFKLYKFKTMKVGSDKKGLLTVGNDDERITKIGSFLRKYKIDELPQLFNVLFGTMSFVGPRPEVRKYVELYTKEQQQILTIKPGITDYASLEYFNENELLADSANPEQTYIQQILPDKIKLNQRYLNNQNLKEDFILIFRTFLKIIN